MGKREPDIREEQLEGIESLVKKFHNDFIETGKIQKNKKDIKLSDIKADKGSLVALVKEIKADNKITRENFVSTFFNNTENIISAIDDLSEIIGGNLGNIEKLQEEQVKETKKVKKETKGVKKATKKKAKKEPKPKSRFDELFGPKAKDVQFKDFFPDPEETEDKIKKSKGLFSTLFRGIFSGFKKLAFMVPEVEDTVDKFQKFWGSNLRKALFSPLDAMKFLIIRGAQEVVQVVRGTVEDWKNISKSTGKVFGVFGKGIKGVKKGVRAIGLAFKFLGGSIKIIVGLIALAIAAIGFAIYQVVKNWKKIKTTIKEGIAGITTWITDKWNWVKDGISNAINSVSGFFSDMFAGIKDSIKSVLGERISKFIFGDEKEGAASDATKASSSEKESQKKVEAQDQTRMIREVTKISGATPVTTQQSNEDVVDSIKKLTSTMDKKDMGGGRQVSPAPASNIEDLGTVLATRE